MEPSATSTTVTGPVGERFQTGTEDAHILDCLAPLRRFHDSGTGIMKTSQWRQAVENRCVFSACLKALSDRSGDRSAGGRRFHVVGPLTAKLRCPIAVRLRGTSGVLVLYDT